MPIETIVTANTYPKLIVFYDGRCPLCVKEMTHLQKQDASGQLRLVDIYAKSFTEDYPEMQSRPVLQRLHGYLLKHEQDSQENYQLITGLDVTYHAWKCIGKGWLIKPLRWPIIRTIADACYLFFAKHRFTISYLLTGKERCQQCTFEESQ